MLSLHNARTRVRKAKGGISQERKKSDLKRLTSGASASTSNRTENIPTDVTYVAKHELDATVKINDNAAVKIDDKDKDNKATGNTDDKDENAAVKTNDKTDNADDKTSRNSAANVEAMTAGASKTSFNSSVQPNATESGKRSSNEAVKSHLKASTVTSNKTSPRSSAERNKSVNVVVG